MPSHDRRAAARRRAWGRGPIILRFEPLEGRQLLTASPQPLPDLVASAFTTVHNADWGQTIEATGQIRNQGQGTAQGAFRVDIYASSTPAITPQSVKIGEATIPAGLAPGQTSSFDQKVTLPSSPVPGFGPSSKSVYIGLWVNPDRATPESNTRNNLDLGPGLDTSAITVTPQQPAQLIGTSLSVSPSQAQWGGTFQLYTQIHNNAQGDAPPTRARIVLTPSNATPGGPADVTIGSINVPSISAWQTVNLVQPVTLPAAPPTTLVGSSQFVLSVVPDADFLINALYPGPNAQGLGRDQAVLQIDPNPTPVPASGPKPDLAATTVFAPSQPIFWGQSLQVSTAIQNIGQGDAGPFLVRYLLVGAGGSLNHSLVLADVTINGVRAGYSQSIVQTLKLPVRVPNGLLLDSAGIGRIAVVIDPENSVDEVTKTDNTALSGPVTLRVLGTDGRSTVPMAPPVSLTPSATTPTPNAPQPNRPIGVYPGRRIHRKPAPHHTIDFHQIEHNLRLFPKRVTRLVRNLFKTH